MSGVCGGSALAAAAFYIDTSTPGGALVELGAYQLPAPHPADQLLSLKVITSGSNYWFYAGGQFLGSASHGTGGDGAVGIAMICFDDTAVCATGYGNLTIRALAS